MKGLNFAVISLGSAFLITTAVNIYTETYKAKNVIDNVKELKYQQKLAVTTDKINPVATIVNEESNDKDKIQRLYDAINEVIKNNPQTTDFNCNVLSQTGKISYSECEKIAFKESGIDVSMDIKNEKVKKAISVSTGEEIGNIKKVAPAIQTAKEIEKINKNLKIAKKQVFFGDENYKNKVSDELIKTVKNSEEAIETIAVLPDKRKVKKIRNEIRNFFEENPDPVGLKNRINDIIQNLKF